ncbi:MAG: 2-amino-4-hydroxy-6-hydroxymethyldihydropteridine pyrophosphokinase [Bacteroidetes bacterium]|nr:2-amino-4-hydroxy-6-hydroxymethyldihydropteridine pyrophosphokinase [Bacteroidota bacterium]
MSNSYIVSIGSNSDAEQKVEAVKKILTERFDQVVFSDFKWVPPVGDHYKLPFYNGAVRFLSGLDPVDLKQQLKAIESILGRTPDQKAVGVVPIDLDIIVCNKAIVHIDYERFPFVKEATDSLLKHNNK